MLGKHKLIHYLSRVEVWIEPIMWNILVQMSFCTVAQEQILG